MSIREIIPGLTQIDLLIPEAGFRKFITAWLIQDKKRDRTLLVETGPTSAVGALLCDLEQLGVRQIDFVLYTHIHLDHSGGIGTFHNAFPDALVVAPQKGRGHLVSPQKLWEASKRNLGETLLAVYGEPVPLPETSLAPEGIRIEGLDIISTPGHASHHDSYVYDLDGVRILFVGEAAGYSEDLPGGKRYMRPATPHTFFYETALASIDRLLASGCFDLICYPHRGCSWDAQELLDAARGQLVLWKEILSVMPQDASLDDCYAVLSAGDPCLANIALLPEEDRVREEMFVRNSIKGYLGYLTGERARKASANTTTG